MSLFNKVLGGGPDQRAAIAGGRHTSVAATDTIVTGLEKVEAVVVSYETAPADANLLVSAAPNANAPGSIDIKYWKTDGSDPTPVAATAFAKVVNWIAIGY